MLDSVGVIGINWHSVPSVRDAFRDTGNRQRFDWMSDVAGPSQRVRDPRQMPEVVYEEAARAEGFSEFAVWHPASPISGKSFRVKTDL